MRLLSLVFCLLFSCCLSAQVKSLSEGVDFAIPTGAPTPHLIQIRTCRPRLSTEEPLFIINGFSAEKLNLNQIDPANIESINVLKGENATALYGSRAIHGVIIIQTKDNVVLQADYTLTPEEIPADLFSLYETQDFGAGKEVVYLLNGKRTKLRKIKKISTTEISAVKVYQSEFKIRLMGYSEQEIVVDVLLR